MADGSVDGDESEIFSGLLCGAIVIADTDDDDDDEIRLLMMPLLL